MSNCVVNLKSFKIFKKKIFLFLKLAQAKMEKNEFKKLDYFHFINMLFCLAFLYNESRY